ncbi:hypothetical protein [Hymenobacter metallicola]|uniref:Uncharacterized protein n=1 Tax=Hymenobacter metallicola TaxID=2563114 RepID=A0A4Z0PT70_9BACT|nr:hypothetical protein [Hymenobacter metallicola]TGE20917.1 hypothetical protein E5K02_25285 [Hymenobacter metallicola]
MRPSLFLLAALGACTTQRVSVPAASTCHVMREKKPVEYAAADTTAAYAAVQDFTQHVGAPHALLYMVTVSGRPNQSRCLRIVQRGPDRFTAYTYRRPGQVDSTHFSSSALAKLLPIPSGHFTTLCLDYRSAVRQEMLWVKQGSVTTCSLAGEFADVQVPNPPGPSLQPLAGARTREGVPFLLPADSVVLQPALNLLHEVKALK